MQERSNEGISKRNNKSMFLSHTLSLCLFLKSISFKNLIVSHFSKFPGWAAEQPWRTSTRRLIHLTSPSRAECPLPFPLSGAGPTCRGVREGWEGRYRGPRFLILPDSSFAGWMGQAFHGSGEGRPESWRRGPRICPISSTPQPSLSAAGPIMMAAAKGLWSSCSMWKEQ